MSAAGAPYFHMLHPSRSPIVTAKVVAPMVYPSRSFKLCLITQISAPVCPLSYTIFGTSDMSIRSTCSRVWVITDSSLPLNTSHVGAVMTRKTLHLRLPAQNLPLRVSHRYRPVKPLKRISIRLSSNGPFSGPSTAIEWKPKVAVCVPRLSTWIGVVRDSSAADRRPLSCACGAAFRAKIVQCRSARQGRLVRAER